MGKVIDIDAMEPHLTGELICVRCGYRYIGCWNEKVWLKDLYCPNCQQPGFTIGTGQIMEHGPLEGYTKDNPRKVDKPGMVLQFPGLKNDDNKGGA